MDVPLDFVPLSLVLLPGRQIVDCTRADVLIGRHSGADIRLTPADISRRHCRLVFADGHWRVIDLNRSKQIAFFTPL